jgi:hypothetical protein
MVGGIEISKMFSNPVIFILLGYIADTRLKVFEVEFYVHSIILKIGSIYFKKFLDSANKAASPSIITFQYEYVAIVDDDGETWGLEAVFKVSRTFVYY